MRPDAHQGEFLGLINFGSGLIVRGTGTTAVRRGQVLNLEITQRARERAVRS